MDETTMMFQFGFVVLMIVLYGLPTLGIIAGAVIAKQASSGKTKKFGIALLAVSAVILVALVARVIWNGIQFGF